MLERDVGGGGPLDSSPARNLRYTTSKRYWNLSVATLYLTTAIVFALVLSEPGGRIPESPSIPSTPTPTITPEPTATLTPSLIGRCLEGSRVISEITIIAGGQRVGAIPVTQGDC